MKRRVVKQSSLSGGAGISGADIEAVSAKLVKPVFSSKRKQLNQQEQNPETTNNNQNNTEQQKSFQQQQSVPPYQQQVPQPQYQPQMMPFGQQQMFPPYYFPPYFYQPNQDQNRLMQFILERETAFTKKDAYKMATMFNDKINEEKKLDRILDAINGLNNKQINNHYHLLPFQQQPITSQPIIGPYNIQQPVQSQPLIKPQVIRGDNTEEIENLRLENERLKRDLENEINYLKNVNKSLNDDNALLGNKIEHINDKNNKLIQDNKTLADQLNDLNANNQEKDSEINRLKGIIDNLQRQIGQLNSNIANNDDYKNLLEDKNNEINALKSNISNLETNIGDKDKTIQDLTSQLDHEKYKNLGLNNKYNELNGKLSLIKNQMDNNGLENKQEIQNLKNQLQSEKNKLNEAERKARNKDNENTKLQYENDTLRNQISDLNNKLLQSPTQNTVDTLNDRIRELNSEIDNLRNKINSSPKQSDLDDLQNRLSNERKQNAYLQDKYDSLNISLQNYRRNQNGMNDKYNNLNCENVELRNNNNDLKNQNNNYQQQLIEKENEIDNLKLKLDRLNSQIKVLKHQKISQLEPIQEEPIAVEFQETHISTPQIAQQTRSITQTPIRSQTTSFQYNRNIPNNCYSSRKDETAEEILKDKIFFGIPSMPKYLFMYDLRQNDLFVNEEIGERDYRRLMSERDKTKNHTNKNPIVFFNENCDDYINKIRSKLFKNICDYKAKATICKQFIEQTEWNNKYESKNTYPTTWLSRSENGGLILNEEHKKLVKKVCDSMIKMGHINNNNINRERYGNEIPVAVPNSSGQTNNNFDIINYQQRHKNPLTSTGKLNKLKDRKGAMHYIMNNNLCANNIYSNNIRNIKSENSQYSRGNFNNKYNYYQ